MSILVRRPAHSAALPPAPPVPPAPTGPTPEQRAAFAEAEVLRLQQRLGECESAYRGWRQRALDAEQLLDSLPSEIALPHALISRTAAERDVALHLARRYRLAWTNARRRALPANKPKDGIK